MKMVICATAAALFTYSINATFWDDLLHHHPAHEETIDILKMTVEEAEKPTATEDIINFAYSVNRLRDSFLPNDYIWVHILEVYRLVVTEYLYHPQELIETLKDREGFFNMIRQKAGIQFGITPDDKGNK